MVKSATCSTTSESGSVSDPFAGFSVSVCSVASEFEVYVSVNLSTVRAKSGYCGQWLMVGDVWFRRLDAQVLLWFRAQIRKAIEAHGETESLSEALAEFDRVRQAGLAHGAFAEDEVSEWCQPSPAFSWWDGCPRWVEGY